MHLVGVLKGNIGIGSGQCVMKGIVYLGFLFALLVSILLILSSVKTLKRLTSTPQHSERIASGSHNVKMKTQTQARQNTNNKASPLQRAYIKTFSRHKVHPIKAQPLHKLYPLNASPRQNSDNEHPNHQTAHNNIKVASRLYSDNKPPLHKSSDVKLKPRQSSTNSAPSSLKSAPSSLKSYVSKSSLQMSDTGKTPAFEYNGWLERISVKAYMMYEQAFNNFFPYQPNNFSKEAFPEDGYQRDDKGYLYPSAYFDIKDSNQLLVESINLKGRHSDYVLPPCNDPRGVKPNETDPIYNLAGPFNYLPEYKNPCWHEPGNILRCVPYVYIIGTVKAGTTDLLMRLLRHPDTVEPIPYEKRWFADDRFRYKTRSSIQYYLEQFVDQIPELNNAISPSGYHPRILIDDSPTTTYNNVHWKKYPGNEWCVEPRVTALSHIHHLNPKAKLILNVRNPVDRLYSEYLFNLVWSNGKGTAKDFHERVVNTLAKYRSCFRKHTFRRCLFGPETYDQSTIKSEIHAFAGGIYSRLILDVLKIFPRDQLLVRRTEQGMEDKVERLREVYDFLDLTPLTNETLKKYAETPLHNIGTGYKKAGPMLRATRILLKQFYQPFNEELAYIMNNTKFLWMEYY